MSQAARAVSRIRSSSSPQHVTKTSTVGTSFPIRRSLGRLRFFKINIDQNDCKKTGTATDISTAMKTHAIGKVACSLFWAEMVNRIRRAKYSQYSANVATARKGAR